jgi:uncharacterized protein
MKAAFVVSAGELDAGGKAFVRTIPRDWLVGAFAETEAKPLGDGLVDMRLSKSGADVVVHGKVKAEVEVPCSRCLDPVRITLAPEISVLFEPASRTGKKARSDEAELTTTEADVLPYDGENVILDDVLRDDLVLDIPMIPLCSEGCPGIASAAEASKAETRGEKPLDPRLAPLLRLKKQKE